MIQDILRWFNLQWLLQPSVSLFGVFVFTFLAAFTVMLLVRRFDSFKRTKPSWVRSLLVAVLACTLVYISSFFDDGSGDAAEEASSLSAESRDAIQLPDWQFVNLTWTQSQRSPDEFAIGIQKQGDDVGESFSRTVRGKNEESHSFWKSFEEELDNLNKQHPTGHFLFTLKEVQTPQVQEDIRTRLNAVFPDRCELDTIYMINE